MTAHPMYRYTLIAPDVTNDGAQGDHANFVREGLLAAGIDGWTEYDIVGSWRGQRESGVLFEIYRVNPTGVGFAELLGRIGRTAMPDQEAVQVTFDRHPVTVWEA